MTHFVGLVVAETEDEIAALVQPFHEYECTGVDDQYVIDVDITDETRADFEKHAMPGQSFEEFAAHWHGRPLVDGRMIERTNPNAKWDWWVVGGRWRNIAPNNTCKVEEIDNWFPDWKPGVIVDADGWHEAKSYGWFGFSEDTKTPEIVSEKIASLKGKRVWVVDFHI